MRVSFNNKLHYSQDVLKNKISEIIKENQESGICSID